MTIKAAVVAMDRLNAIGYDNDLPWGRTLKDDLAHFRQLTLGKTLIMGRKTFDSIGARPLPKRENIVVSRGVDQQIEGVKWAASPAEAYALASHDDVFVIGGAGLWETTFDDLDRLYVTYVDAEFPEATVFFPQISCEDWTEVAREHYEADERNQYAFDIVTYERVDSMS